MPGEKTDFPENNLLPVWQKTAPNALSNLNHKL